ncbi:hydrogenase-4 component E [Anaerobacterium chartisolvens]|uniref:Hydrogenase-4 component E n=1 Tax=Anaerobacterium chartisolvens TaxID=1297424 RepID=A0A369B5S2_9FIRM|nr:NADH-quinone oxidoreductase subunit K [Anaerobacterium chartisolvens]RCX16869.1 hydrogenase-4 component E [Anaerobacterium chartisolvens]
MFKLEEILNILSMLILISAFILVANKRVNSYIKTFRLQSMLLAAAAGTLGIYHMAAERKFDSAIIMCLLIILLKVIFIPGMLNRICKRVEYKVEKDFFINIPISIIICCGLAILVWYVISLIPDIKGAYEIMFLTNSISLVMIGLFFMISRKKAIGQIIGFLVIENGMFMAALLTTFGMPMIVEIGIFFDVLAAVLIMGVFVFRINESFDSIDIDKLRNLRG